MAFEIIKLTYLLNHISLAFGFEIHFRSNPRWRTAPKYPIVKGYRPNSVCLCLIIANRTPIASCDTDDVEGKTGPYASSSTDGQWCRSDDASAPAAGQRQQPTSSTDLLCRIDTKLAVRE